MKQIARAESDCCRLVRRCIADGVLLTWSSEQQMVDAIGRRADGRRQPSAEVTYSGWRIVDAFVIRPMLRRMLPDLLPPDEGPLHELCVTGALGQALDDAGRPLAWSWRDDGTAILTANAAVIEWPSDHEGFRRRLVDAGRRAAAVCRAVAAVVRERVTPLTGAEAAVNASSVERDKSAQAPDYTPPKRRGGRPKKYNATEDERLLARYEAAELSHKQGVKAFANGIGRTYAEV